MRFFGVTLIGATPENLRKLLLTLVIIATVFAATWLLYWQIGGDWLELTVRFLSPDHGTREIKDKMTRDILAALGEADISIASTSYEITGIPPIRIERSSVRNE